MRYLYLVLAILSHSINSIAQTQNWLVVSDRAKITFVLGEDAVTGSFTGVDAKIVFDENKLDSSSFYASLDPTTINTGNRERDEHLMAADYFNVEKYPEIIFESSKIVRNESEGGYVALGKLTIKDKTLDIKLPFVFDDRDGEAVFRGMLKVNAIEFGVLDETKKGKEIVKITVHIPAKKQ